MQGGASGAAVPRFASVDALRGITVAAMLLVNNPGSWDFVYAPLEHAPWHGCTPTDLIFPAFLFVMGVSVTLGLAPRLERGADRARLRREVLLRAARIVGLGLLLHLIAWLALDREYFRPWGVLQRIGVCFAAAGLLAIHARARTQWCVLAALLLGYWALLAAGGSYEPWTNLASRLDAALWGPHNYRFDAASGHGHDPEGLLSTLPAIATALLGVRAGAWLREGRLGALLLGGAAALALGAAWALVFPLNKNLWTSSYVLWTGGWTMLALAACHVAIDRRGWPALGRRFGVNAIAAFAGSALMVYLLLAMGWWEPAYRLGFAQWMTPRWGPYLPSLAFALAFVALWWGIVYGMDRRGWRLRI
ncbi:acyltransferase family protein [Luteimonas aquatica]|uniref:acyltransferase family protein n=1 Tax=Luteimonas aquatica TaxID=450364 RepID=UPI001F589CEB|nr:heparan-alpha-glucosaminide N-acetyltransferase domain-containing protein [Luteimonas aquatica]